MKIDEPRIPSLVVLVMSARVHEILEICPLTTIGREGVRQAKAS